MASLAPSKPLSPSCSLAAELNRNIMWHLQAALDKDPETDILGIIPKDYQNELKSFNRTTTAATTTYVRRAPNPYYKKPLKIDDLGTLPDLFEQLDKYNKLTIHEPLSKTVIKLLAEHIPSASDANEHPPSILDPNDHQALIQPLRMMLRSSDTLFAALFRGAVFRCGEAIVAKLSCGALKGLQNEYATLQFLTEQASDIPVPRAHGLVSLGHCHIAFMAYMPSTTLEAVWPTLDYDQKLSVQHQLGDILTKLRRLKQDDGEPLGNITYRRVFDRRAVLCFSSDKTIRTGAEYEDFIFSAEHRESDAYVKFLRGLLPRPVQESVFSHGDLRPANITVHLEHGTCTVTGIVDWEDSGFYPEHHEVVKATNRMDGDWFLFLPSCIAPRNFPVQWLVDRLWGRSIGIGH